MESRTLPMLECPQAQVTLYATKKRAHEALRERSSELVASGWKRGYGTLGGGVMVLERGTDVIGLGLDYAGRLARGQSARSAARS